MRPRSRTVALWTVWSLTRVTVVALMYVLERPVLGDVRYYVGSLDALPRDGIAHTLVEYPLPGVAIVAVPWLLARALGALHAVAAVVAVLSCVADAAFLWLLDRGQRGEDAGARRAPSWLWVAGPPLLGATCYARFDMVPAVLVGAALLLAGRRPVLAGGALAVATGAKLWPLLLAPALAALRAGRGRVVAGFAGTGVALVAGSLAVAGWDRLVSPLTYQSARGLQVESVAATPLVLARVWDHGSYRVFFSPYRAMEIQGAGDGMMLRVASLAIVLLAVSLLVLWWRSWRTPGLSPDAVTWLCLSGVTGFVVVSKVFSAQYVLWLLPVAVAGLAVSTTVRGRGGLTRWSSVLLVVAVLTQVEYPLGYGGVVAWEPDWSPWVSAVIAVRNVLVALLLLAALREAWWHTGRGARDDLSGEGRSPATHPGRAGTSA